MPASTSEASSSDESTLNQITSDDSSDASSDASSESIEPTTPSDEATTTEKGKPINKKKVSSYYEA